VTEHGGPAEAPVVELRGVRFVYPGPPAVQALNGIDLTVRRGEYVAIVGASGSGKSTLLNLLGLLDRPTSGGLALDGIDVGSLREGQRTALRASRIGFVFQAFHLLPYRSAVENVALALLYRATSRRSRNRQAAEALDRVGLAHRSSAMTVNLSGGERQRVAIARALVGRPSLLLCDEPTGNLDSGTAAKVLGLIQQLHDDGMTVVMITHDPAVAARATRAVRMHDGAIKAAMR
jgi:putative ABC transport system ATP-binding protein